MEFKTGKSFKMRDLRLRDLLTVLQAKMLK